VKLPRRLDEKGRLSNRLDGPSDLAGVQVEARPLEHLFVFFEKCFRDDQFEPARNRQLQDQGFRGAETKTFVSRTALTTRTTSFPAIATNLQIDFPQRKLIDSLGFRLPLDGGQGRWFLHEVPEVVLDAHNDGLRLPAPVDHKPLSILLDPPQDLPELGPGSQGGNDFGHGFSYWNGESLRYAFE
jgi:hypothetical protein